MITYKNGNAVVSLMSDGTRVITSPDDEFKFDFAMSVDMKITDNCANGCPFCHEQSTPQGKHGSIDYKFLETIPFGVEVALGGGNVLNHPQFEELLKKLRNQGAVANTTLHMKDWIDNAKYIHDLQVQGYLNGVGISFDRKSFEDIWGLEEYWNDMNVFHFIAGVHRLSDYFDVLDYCDAKALILGYKSFGRGANLSKPEKQIQQLAGILPVFKKLFKVISFDNLAIEQLGVKDIVSEEEWDKIYQGDEATMSYYIDLVEGKFGQNSTTPKDERLAIGDLSFKEMFDLIRVK